MGAFKDLWIRIQEAVPDNTVRSYVVEMKKSYLSKSKQKRVIQLFWQVFLADTINGCTASLVGNPFKTEACYFRKFCELIAHHI